MAELTPEMVALLTKLKSDIKPADDGPHEIVGFDAQRGSWKARCACGTRTKGKGSKDKAEAAIQDHIDTKKREQNK